MRLFLLPISTRRTLIYCERVPHTVTPGKKQPIADRIIDKASQTWADWEAKEKGWQRKVTDYGNHLFRRIPFEEWGLKTIPPGTDARLAEVDQGNLKFECLYPGAFLKGSRVPAVLREIATSRQGYHKGKMWSSIGWMPLTLPFTVVPVIPNLPFFYLCFRAYSHYRAWFGGKLLDHLMKNSLVATTASAQLDTLYTAGLLHSTRQASRDAPRPTEEDTARVAELVETQSQGDKEEVMVLQKWNGKLLAEEFRLPEMEVEIERAVEQVEASIKKNKEELKEEKEEIVEEVTKEEKR